MLLSETSNVLQKTVSECRVISQALLGKPAKYVKTVNWHTCGGGSLV